MAQRKPLSKKTRFEVFKRDNFTCQYCGSKAPDIILEVDHIHPVKEGGENDMMNLITSCFNCNRGKSKNKISDNSVISKQRKQIEELNLRRQQLEMMLDWRNELSEINYSEINYIFNYINSFTEDYSLIDECKLEIKQWLKKYKQEEILESIDIAFDKYFNNTDGSLTNTFNKIGAILNVKSMPEHKQKIAYIKGICKNKFHDYDSQEASIELLELYNNGVDLDVVKEKIINDNFLSFRQFIYQSKIQNIWH